MTDEERKGISKKQLLTQAKENAELADFLKTLTREEIQRIEDTRKYNDIPPGSVTYKIAVLCDALRQNQRKVSLMIRKRVWSIRDISNMIQRLRGQLESGNIVEKTKNELVMTADELHTYIQHCIWLRDGEFYALYPLFGELRGVVGHKDVARQVIMTEDEFDKLVFDVAGELKPFGYDVLNGIHD